MFNVFCYEVLIASSFFSLNLMTIKVIVIATQTMEKNNHPLSLFNSANSAIDNHDAITMGWLAPMSKP